MVERQGDGFFRFFMEVDRPGKPWYAGSQRARGERQMTHEENETPKQNQNRFLRMLEGQEVFLVFLDGKAVQGVLTGFDTYTLFLQREDGLEVAVFKHAIKYMHAAPKKRAAKANSSK
jgi:sRNA-binding regulator protein Hfq